MVIYPTVDAWVNESATGQNNGAAAKLYVNGGTSGNDRYSFIHFGKPFPVNANVTSATLKLYLGAAWSGAHTITVTRVTGAKWSETGITWANKPSVTTTHQATASVTDGVAGDEVEFDITDLMQDVANAGVYYGLRIAVDVDANRSFYSSEYSDSDFHPVIEIEWSEAPEAPTNLYPANDQSVDIDDPVLSWTFVDKSGNTTQASSQVQVSADPADFDATPDYDSTKVANTESNFDLSTDAGFTALVDAQVVYWRVKVWDGTDLESAWSDVASFNRDAQGTLTLDYPSGATVPTVTPLIQWTLTGETQESYEVILEDVTTTPTVRVWRTKTLSTDDSVEVPAGYIKTGKDYRVTIRTWDTKDRASTIGDPDYLEDFIDFSYDRDGTPDPVESLTATASEAAVDLAWSITVEPDYFCLVVDGVEVLPRIDPADVLVSGTDYAMTWWSATPRVASTYEVEAVVNDAGVLKHSNGNPTDSATTNPMGIWLVDPDDDTAVMIAGKEPAGLSIGESGTTYALVGSDSLVRITDSIRGYEGDISGTLLGKTARDDFLTLKERLKELRLIVGDLNFACWLEEVAVPPSPVPGDVAFPVSFRVFQTGE